MYFINYIQLIIKTTTIIIAFIIFSNIQTVSAGAAISLDNIIDTPDRTVTYQGNNYEIQDIGAYLIGETVNVSVSVSGITSFQISLLDKNKNFLWNHMVYRTGGKSEMTVPGDVITEPGTYAFAILYQGNILAVKPVVFSGYDLSVVPDSTAIVPGSTLHVKVEVVPDTSLPVKVVLARNSSSLESAADRTGRGLFETDIKIPHSASGNFSLYAAVITPDTLILGYPELTGVSSGGVISVGEPSPVENTTSSVDVVSLIIVSILLTAFLILVWKKERS